MLVCLFQNIATSLLCLAALSFALPVREEIAVDEPTVDSAVPFGAVVDRCVIPGTVALTFDDGPFIYTERTLDILRENGARATFFVNGQATGNVYAFAGIVQRALAEGHQVGSHT